MNRLALALGVTLVAATAAHAETLTMGAKVIPYRAADLATQHGAAEMLIRIDRTAGDLCAAQPSPANGHKHRAQIAGCRGEAVERAVHDLNAPLVTAAFQRRQGADRDLAAAR